VTEPLLAAPELPFCSGALVTLLHAGVLERTVPGAPAGRVAQVPQGSRVTVVPRSERGTA
jgi:hypothetical protein